MIKFQSKNERRQKNDQRGLDAETSQKIDALSKGRLR
jgi:hypothetical protein